MALHPEINESKKPQSQYKLKSQETAISCRPHCSVCDVRYPNSDVLQSHYAVSGTDIAYLRQLKVSESRHSNNQSLATPGTRP
eukprot:2835409-Rhodomonas_salina.3